MDKEQLKDLLDQIEVNDFFDLPYLDKQEIENILESFIEFENDTAQKCRYIHILTNTTGNCHRARVLFEKELKFAQTREWYLIAERIVESMNDRDWAERIYRGALAELNSTAYLSKLAVSVSKYLDDEKFTGEIFEKAIDLAVDSGDYRALLSACSQQISLAEYHSRALEELRSASTGPEDYLLLGEEFSMLNDYTRADHYFRVALSLARKELSFATMISIFNKRRHHLPDDKPESISFLAECAAGAFNAASEAGQYAQLADSLSTLFPKILETKLTGQNMENLIILTTEEAPMWHPQPPYIIINDSPRFAGLRAKGRGHEPFNESDGTLYRVLGKTLAKLIK